MTRHSAHLLSLGRDILKRYTQLPVVACAAITGSSAEGHSDEFSDLDMTVYYDALPPEAQIRAVRETVGGGPLIWTMGDPNDGDFAEAFRVREIEVQIGHITVSRWEAEIERTLRGEEPASPQHKAMSGTLVSTAVFGEPLLQRWQSQLREYPDVLAVAMVKHHLKFFGVWAVYERLARRDANLWIRQSMVESSFNILGALAGLNRKYFTSFQFKRMRAFVDSLDLAPTSLSNRLDALWTSDLRSALTDLRALVLETTELIEREMPTIDTTAARKAIDRKDGRWNIEN
jgi:hypothetical protein